jgi:transitional endoplasmic reticulum ATPase
MSVTKQAFGFSRLGTWIKIKYEEEQRTPRFVIPILFLLLALVANVWIPFYPLWMALIIASIVGILSFRFPFLSLVVLSLFVCAAAAYQTPEFGLFMLLFFMILLIISLFEWRLGYLVFLTIALSRFGLSLVVPVVSAMALSLFLSLAVVVVSGIFLTFLVTCGNLTVAGMFVGPVHQSSFMAFYRPVAETFAPSNIGSALFGMDGADLDIISRVMSDNLGMSIVPILEIIVWGLAVYLVYRYFHRTSAETKHPVKTAIIPSGIIAGSFFFAYAILLTPEVGGIVAGVLLFGVVFTAILIGRAGKIFFTPYISTLDVDVGIGTRISEMENLGESSFELVGGLADVKEDLRESIVVPLLMSDVAKKYGIDPPKGILLFGPPGCGKTLLMKALANELHVEMVTVKCSDIMSKWYGESEGKVAELFRIAKERRPCIIFFDDLEAMAKHRDMYSGDDVTPRLLSIILAEMDGMDQSAGIILVGTTNKPELIDPALLRPGRFDKIIYVPPPDVKERVEILKVHLAGRPMDKNIDMTTIAVKCDRFSGADLANLAREAATIAMRRALDTKQHTTITMSDLKTVAVTVKPSITLAMLENYEMLKLDFERKMHHVKRADHGWTVNWDDVGGADRVKKDIKDYIELLIEEPDVLENFRLKTGRGMLLFGPPGCGKKHIMRAAANNLDIPIQEISSTELVGSRSQFMPSVRDIFRRAREATPSIVLISDIDVIGARDTIEGPDASKAIAQILMEIDNVSAKEHILVIATTNRPHTLHPSLLRPGRFDKMFYVPLPDKDARKKIFEIYLRNIPKAKDVDSALLEKLSVMTDSYSAADIAAIVDEAKLMTVINYKAGELRAVTKKELVGAIERVESSITPEDLESAHAFMKTYKVRK